MAKHVLSDRRGLSETRGDHVPDLSLLKQVRHPVFDPRFGARIRHAIEPESRLEHLRDSPGVPDPQLQMIEAGQQTCRRSTARTVREDGSCDGHVINFIVRCNP